MVKCMLNMLKKGVNNGMKQAWEETRMEKTYQRTGTTTA